MRIELVAAAKQSRDFKFTLRIKEGGKFGTFTKVEGAPTPEKAWAQLFKGLDKDLLHSLVEVRFENQ